MCFIFLYTVSRLFLAFALVSKRKLKEGKTKQVFQPGPESLWTVFPLGLHLTFRLPIYKRMFSIVADALVLKLLCKFDVGFAEPKGNTRIIAAIYGTMKGRKALAAVVGGAAHFHAKLKCLV